MTRRRGARATVAEPVPATPDGHFQLAAPALSLCRSWGRFYNKDERKTAVAHSYVRPIDFHGEPWR